MIHSYVKLAPRTATSWSVPALCRAYQWPASMPGGGVIAIPELGGGFLSADMSQFFDTLGLPQPTITSVDVGSSNNGNPSDPASAEVTLDIQIAAAAYSVATGQPANIRVYWYPNTSGAIGNSMRRAAADGCDVWTCSWGTDEANWGSVGLHRLGTAAEAASKAGMVLLAAAGDNNSSDGGNTPANVDSPASCSRVLSCGGTNKSPQGGAEVVWNNNPGNPNGEGTGGGISTYFQRASATWQTGSPSASWRTVPDVAAVADPNTGYQILLGGQTIVIGGTSAVAPLWAGLIASFGRKLGFITPTLYANPVAFTDITSGDNGMYKAMPGVDLCTGLGSPIGSRIAGLFVKGVPAATPVIKAQRRAPQRRR